MTNELKSTFKSSDTEEWLDIYFTRPIGLLWARLFRSLGIHPNVVTLLSIILGIAAGICFYFPDYVHTIIGILLQMWANFYDSADGQLARMTGQKTRMGRMLDGFAGDAWFFTIYAAICLRLQGEAMPFGTNEAWGLWIWMLAALSGLKCHAEQCRLADYYRNIHLWIIKGEVGSELDNSTALNKEYSTLTWRNDTLWKLFLFFYKRYTKAQEESTPAFQRLRSHIVGTNEFTAEQRATFRAGSLPLMKWTNILTFNTRAIVLYTSLLVMQPWIYFVAEITVFQTIYYYMRWKHENLCKQMLHTLS